MDAMDLPIYQKTVHFPGGHSAQVVVSSSGIDQRMVHTIVRTLKLPMPRALLMLAGGANFPRSLYNNLTELFINGIASVAAEVHAVVIDGGTQAGVMQLMGEGIAEKGHVSPLLGVAPAQLVYSPDQVKPHGESMPLDPNHSHFVLVDGTEWGDETAMMYELAGYFSQFCPSVALLVNGGAIAKREVLYNVRQRRPVVIIEGSSRLADTIVTHWRAKTLPEGDQELCEILQFDQLYVFQVTDSSQHFMDLVRRLLREQERKPQQSI